MCTVQGISVKECPPTKKVLIGNLFEESQSFREASIIHINEA